MAKRWAVIKAEKTGAALIAAMQADPTREPDRQFYGDALNAKLGRPPVPCPNRERGNLACMCFQCHKLRMAERPWTERTLHCPCCRREMCTVECGSGAHVEVTKPCEGCQREGRTRER